MTGLHVISGMLTGAVLIAGCSGGAASSPVAPTVIRETVVVGPEALPPSPPGPHFALELAGGAVMEGEPWVGQVSVLMNPSIIRPELPASVRTICGGETRTVGGFQGSQRLSCLLPVGSHQVLAQAIMADGRVYQTATTAVVRFPPSQVLPLHYDVVESGRNYTDVAFGFMTFQGAEYHWAFGDGATETTRLNGTQHRYEGGAEERQASVRVTKDGRTIATGSVVGRW